MVTKLRLAREATNIKQSEFADRIGMNRANWRMIETGRASITGKDLRKVANGLGVSVDDLLEIQYGPESK